MIHKKSISDLYSIPLENREELEALVAGKPALAPERELMLHIEQAISHTPEESAPPALRKMLFQRLPSAFIRPWHLLLSAALLCIGSVISLRVIKLSPALLQQESTFILTFCIYGLLLSLLLLPLATWLRSHYLLEAQKLMGSLDHYLEQGWASIKNSLHR